MLELKLVISDVIILFTAAVLGTAFYNVSIYPFQGKV